MPTSLTLVPVGPVIFKSPAFLKKLYESLLIKESLALTPAFLLLILLAPLQYAPAASVIPSIPSVPAKSADILSSFVISIAKARAISEFLPLDHSLSL